MFAESINRLLVVTNEIGGDVARVVRRQHSETRDLHRDHLSINLDLRRTARRKDEIADLVRGSQHSAQQRGGRDLSWTRKAFQRNMDGCNGWCCHSLLYGSGSPHHRMG